MFIPTGFNSWREYSNFALAREFRRHDNPGEVFVHSTNIIQKIGSFLSKPIVQLTDLVFKNFRNPLVISGIAIVAIAAASIAFYPTKTMEVFSSVVPLMGRIRPWMVQMALFLLVQGTILDWA